MGAWQAQGCEVGKKIEYTVKVSDRLGGFVMQVLYTIAALGVADELGRKGPQTAQELAYSLGMHSFSCTRPLQFSFSFAAILGSVTAQFL